MLAGTLLLAACGGGGDDDVEASEDPEAGRTPAASEEQDATTDDEGDGEPAEGVAISHLPFDVEAPSGYRMVTDECQAGDDADEEDGSTYHSPIVYAVPEDWVTSGRGSAGSGGVLGTDLDLTFTTDTGDKVEVELSWDSRGADGEITDWEGEPWTTFDYDSQVGDATTRIEFDEVATITVDDQDIDIFHMDPAQAPEHVSDEEYRARVAVADLTAMHDPDGVNEYTAVVTVTFSSDATGVTQDVVETLVGSLGMPTCTWDDLLVREETFRNVDLDGDGEVKSQDEALAEMQEELDALLEEEEG